VVSTQEEQDLVTQLKKFGVFIEDKGLADELKLLNSFLNGFKYPNQSKYLPPEVNNDAGKMAGRVDLLECLNKRKSGDKAGKILKHSDIKDILFSSYYNQTKINLSLHRPVPSAGKFYPLIYYYFDFGEKKLYYVDKDSNLDFILKSARPDHLVSYLEYFKIDISAWNGIILTFADLSKSQAKYDLRSYVFSLIECGHVMQNIILSCLALGTETRQIGLLNSNVVDEYLDIKNNENLFLHAILV
jgi:SagB-type dehydrogenase family enzyme